MSDRKVLYSVGMPLNRGGLGSIAWHACKGLMDAGMLGGVVSPEVSAAGSLAAYARGMPWPFERAAALLNRLGWQGWKDDYFDRWASVWIEPGMDYYGWMHQSLACIRKCHQGGGKTFIDRGTVEIRLQKKWLEEEYRRFGISHAPISPVAVSRMICEMEESDFITVPSTLVAETHVAAGYRPCKLRINPLGVDAGRFTPAPLREVQERKNLRFVFVGQLSIQKGLPGLLDAWKKLAPAGHELVLAGIIPPGERSIMEPRLREAKGVIWNGHVSSVEKLLPSCDVLILPSIQDGFGMVVLEAFACGLPVIVSDRVGARDCVREKMDGFIYPHGEKDALADRMGRFLEKRELRVGMRENVLGRAREFSWEAYGRRFAGLFRGEGDPCLHECEEAHSRCE